jgi:hypothetical protein
MKLSLILTSTFTLVLAAAASAAGVPLHIVNYNFQLAGGGGGAQATLNGVPVEIFCDDFANEIWVPSDNMANVTTLGSGADLSKTRFGDVASNTWTSITLTGGGAASADQTFFNTGNGAGAAARYAMAAYLISLYNVAQGGTTSSNQIQEAIWTLLDPTAEGPVIDPSGVDPTGFLEQAATWYLGGNAVDSFLSQFQVVSDVNMVVPQVGVGVGGFQEQMVMTPTPEPRGGVLMLLGLFGAGAFLWRRSRRSSALTEV